MADDGSTVDRPLDVDAIGADGKTLLMRAAEVGNALGDEGSKVQGQKVEGRSGDRSEFLLTQSDLTN